MFSTHVGLWVRQTATIHLQVWGDTFSSPTCVLWDYLLWEVNNLCHLATTLLLLGVGGGCSAHACAPVIWFSDHRRSCYDTVSQITYCGIFQMINQSISIQCRENLNQLLLLSCLWAESVWDHFLLEKGREYHLGSEFLAWVCTEVCCKLCEGKYTQCFIITEGNVKISQPQKWWVIIVLQDWKAVI